MSQFESIAILSGKGQDQNDEVWCVVRRYINGAWHRFIERFKAREFDPDTLYDAHFVDCEGSGKAWHNPSTAGSTTIGDYTEYFIGVSPYSGNQIVAKGKDDSTIDTTWGVNGYWDASPNYGPCYCMHQLSDGRLLVGHSYYKVSMINTDGTTDTTWATNGTYTTPSGSNMTVYAILEDASGNFHLFGGVADLTTRYVYVKLDSNGTYLGGLTRAQTKMRIIYGAVWSDSNKTRIIAAGAGVDAVGIPPTYVYPDIRRPNVAAINPTTMAIDTTWTGNVDGSPGFAQYDTGEGNQKANYHIYAMSDGGFVLYRNTAKMLIKILADGSALDTTWATNGELTLSYSSFPYKEGHNPTQDGDDIYLITIVSDGGTKSRFVHVDATGTVVGQYTVASGYSYYSVTIFNEDQLLFGNAQYVELWNKDFSYVSRFAVANTNIVWWVLPDESTRETTIVPGQSESWGTTPTGYAHLEGETVNILADGVKYPQQTVTSAAINETEFSSAIYKTVGLPVEFYVEPMSVGVTALAFIPHRTITHVILNLFRSVDGKVGRDADHLDVIPYSYTNYNAGPTLFTGTIRLPFEGEYAQSGDIVIVCDGPLPFTLRALGVKFGHDSA